MTGRPNEMAPPSVAMTNELRKLKRHATLIAITHSSEIFESPHQVVYFGQLP